MRMLVAMKVGDGLILFGVGHAVLMGGFIPKKELICGVIRTQNSVVTVMSEMRDQARPRVR